MLIYSLKCEPLNLSHSARGPVAKTPSHTDIVEHVSVCGAVCVCACVTALLNNTSFTCQNFKAQHMPRKGREWKREREEWGVGGLEGETKTKIRDEQWWEGQTRSDGWLNDSSQCLPVMVNTLYVCPFACPQLSVYVFGEWHMTNILRLSSLIFIIFFPVSLQITCCGQYYSVSLPLNIL